MYFVKFFVIFGLPKIIVVDADEFFSGMFKKNLQETLLIPVHAVERVKHKEIIKEGFRNYLNKTLKIK